MQKKLIFSLIFCLSLISCKNSYYTEEDFHSELKIDSHIHIGSDDGVFEGQAAADNFLLITLNVDHTDSATVRRQFDYAFLSVKKHPDLTFIGCHPGSLEWNVDSLALRLDRYPNMAVDISARICHLQYQSAKDRKRVRDFCIKYKDRLLYGTDVGYDGRNAERFKKQMHETWIDDWNYFTSDAEMTSDLFDGTFRGIKLPKSVVNKIYSDNAIKWYKLNVNQ